jgi:titin
MTPIFTKKLALLSLISFIAACGGDARAPNSRSATSTLPPLAPKQLVSAAQGATQIRLTWQDPSALDSEADESAFEIERKLDSDAVFASVAAVGAGVTAFVNTGLSANTKYVYRVRAKNAIGASAYSNDASATTDRPPLTRPTAPVSVLAQGINSKTIRLTWDQMDRSNVDHFVVEYHHAAAQVFQVLRNVPADNPMTTDHENIPEGGEYIYRIKAHNAAGDSDYSAEFLGRPLSNTDG